MINGKILQGIHFLLILPIPSNHIAIPKLPLSATGTYAMAIRELILEVTALVGRISFIQSCDSSITF